MHPGRVASVVLAVCGVAWAIVGGAGMAERLWTDWLHAPPSAVWPLAEGIWAGTSAGKWTMIAVAFGRVPRRSLAVLLVGELLAEGLLWWTAGLPHGALLQIPTAVMLIAVLSPHHVDSAAVAPGRARWLMVASAWFVLTGLLLVFAFDGPVFGPYRDAMTGLDASPPWEPIELAYARIGVGFSVHYLTLMLLLRHRGPSPAVLRGAALAQLAWFCTDSPTNLVHGAAFNVLMVNLPAMLLFGLAWGLTWRARDSTVR